MFLVERTEQACHKSQLEDGAATSSEDLAVTCRRAGKRCTYQGGQTDSAKSRWRRPNSHQMLQCYKMLQMLQAQSDFVGSSNCRDAPALLFRYGMNCPGTTQGHPNSDKGPGLASFCSAEIFLGLHHASAPPGCSTHRLSGKTSSSITFSVKKNSENQE